MIQDNRHDVNYLHKTLSIIFSNNNNLIKENLNEIGIFFREFDGNYILKNSKLKELEKITQNYIELWINEFRFIWKHTLPGKMGDKQACLSKMVDFCINTKFIYTHTDILKAANAYVYDTKDYKYLQQADYFIYKTISGNTSSRLLSYLESLEDATNITFSGDNII